MHMMPEAVQGLTVHGHQVKKNTCSSFMTDRREPWDETHGVRFSLFFFFFFCLIERFLALECVCVFFSFFFLLLSKSCD